jgi:undecaprenyl diphosphate synthase
MLRSGIKASDVSEQMIAAHLDTANVPDPDLVIVTGGEKGTADFLLWQAAYAEYDFVDVCWPEFTSAHFDASLLKLQSRDRRFGGVPTATAAE